MSLSDLIALSTLILTIALLSNKNIRLLLGRLRLLYKVIYMPFLIIYTILLVLSLIAAIYMITFPHFPLWLQISYINHSALAHIPMWILIFAIPFCAFLIFSMLDILLDKWYWSVQIHDIKEFYKRLIDAGDES